MMRMTLWKFMKISLLPAVALVAISCEKNPLVPLEPPTVQDLEVIAYSDSSCTLRWTTPSWSEGSRRGATFDLRFVAEGGLLDAWGTAFSVADLPLPLEASTEHEFMVTGLAGSTFYEFGIRTVVQNGDSSAVSGLATVSTMIAGVYVSRIGDDDWPGTREEPKRSLGVGIATAVALGKANVIVSEGQYVENVNLQEGVNLFGGYSADGQWLWDPEAHPTSVVRESPDFLDPIPYWLADNLLIEGIEQETTIKGFHFPPAEEHLTDSFARSRISLYVLDSPGLVLSHCWITTVGGVDGRDGLPGITSSFSATGGSGGAGGWAGDGTFCGDGQHGSRGSDGYPGNAPGGAGGIGSQCDVSGDEPGAGHLGAYGLDGQDGLAGQFSEWWGVSSEPPFPIGYWFPGAEGGETGTEGGAGGGGGGGGGGNSIRYALLGGWIDGPRGGDGGHGGPAGSPGMGGSGGGSAFSILCIESPIRVEYCTISTGSGGRGGDGGAGGEGDFGSNGDPGEIVYNIYGTPFQGGHGGAGGTGRNGGSGGGGSGGLSYCIYSIGEEEPVRLGNSLQTAGSGSGGSGPHPGSDGHGGEYRYNPDPRLWRTEEIVVGSQ